MLLPRSSALALTLAGLVLAALPAAASAKLRNCPLTISQQQHLAGTYTLQLKVAVVTCSRGREVVRAFEKCRKAHGGVKGRCPRTQSVLGYHCTEKRESGMGQFNSTVTCAYGTRRVFFRYSQNVPVR